MNPAFVALFSFAFAMAIGGLWEIFEFSMDNFLGLNMQKTGLVDTMWDLIVDALGALFISVSGFLYMIRRNKYSLTFSTIKKFIKKNKLFFKKV
jgi:hypothetical protein